MNTRIERPIETQYTKAINIEFQKDTVPEPRHAKKVYLPLCAMPSKPTSISNS